MSMVTTKLLSAEEFHDLICRPENADKFLELDRGEVVEMPSPGKRHGFVCGNIAGILRKYAIQQRKGYVCTNDSGIIVERDPDTVRGPDVSFYLDDQTADTMDRKFAVRPPVLVAEVRSPHDRNRQMDRRI